MDSTSEVADIQRLTSPTPSDTCPTCHKISSPWVELASHDGRCSYWRYPACGHTCEVNHGSDRELPTALRRPQPRWT
jgi:hypothetical protein